MQCWLSLPPSLSLSIYIFCFFSHAFFGVLLIHPVCMGLDNLCFFHPFELKPHVFRWATICLDKSKKGLGVKYLSTLNKALLCAWSWQFPNEREAFLNQVIRGKYVEERWNWCPREVRGGYHIWMWKTIRKDYKVLDRQRIANSPSSLFTKS